MNRMEHCMSRTATATMLLLIPLFFTGCVGIAHIPPGHQKKQAVVVAGPAVAPPLLNAKPRLVVIQEWGVSYAADLDDEIYFFDGVWFSFHSNRWFQSRSHIGPWIVVSDAKVPGKLKGAQGWKVKQVPPGQAKKRR